MLFIAIALLFSLSTTFAQKTDAIETFFKKYTDDDSFTSVHIGPNFLTLFPKLTLTMRITKRSAMP